MKTPLLILGLLLTLTSCGDDDKGGMSSLAAQGGNFACRSIARSCEAAGFAKGSAAWQNCVTPIMNGQTGTPAGSTIALPPVDPSIVQACSAGWNGGSGTSTSTSTGTSTASGSSTATASSSNTTTVTNTDASSSGATTQTVISP